MSNEEFFEAYKGCMVQDGNIKGILCGYDTSNQLLMRTPQGWAEYALSIGAYIEDKKSGDRYWNIEREMVDLDSKPIRLSSDLTNAEAYIKKYFPNISEEETDIYINIFMAGVNSKKP